jgi:predicted nuclease of predicted toxin-antitoxin system
VPLRFHLDEHVPNAIASALRRRGIDVTTTSDAGLRGEADEKHFAFASAESRVIYSQDSDFLIAASRGTEHAGIVYNAPGTRKMRQIIDFLVLLDACMTSDEMRNSVEFVPE